IYFLKSIQRIVEKRQAACGAISGYGCKRSACCGSAAAHSWICLGKCHSGTEQHCKGERENGKFPPHCEFLQRFSLEIFWGSLRTLPYCRRLGLVCQKWTGNLLRISAVLQTQSNLSATRWTGRMNGCSSCGSWTRSPEQQRTSAKLQQL